MAVFVYRGQFASSLFLHFRLVGSLKSRGEHFKELERAKQRKISRALTKLQTVKDKYQLIREKNHLLIQAEADAVTLQKSYERSLLAQQIKDKACITRSDSALLDSPKD